MKDDDAPYFQVHRNQAGAYTLTVGCIGTSQFSVHFDTLEDIETAAQEILDAVKEQRERDQDR